MEITIPYTRYKNGNRLDLLITCVYCLRAHGYNDLYIKRIFPRVKFEHDELNEIELHCWASIDLIHGRELLAELDST